ncbi:MAG: hypothetical protein EBV97_10515, partial [Rhodobacteraceae bacterium]|nr:hypothetical protein [Paracoccaceae bacterium]
MTPRLIKVYSIREATSTKTAQFLENLVSKPHFFWRKGLYSYFSACSAPSASRNSRFSSKA